MSRPISNLPENDPKTPFRVIDQNFLNTENCNNYHAEHARRRWPPKEAKER